MTPNNPSKSFREEAVYLIDSSSFIFRAYYAIRAGLTAPDGTPTHATYGFAQMVLSLLNTYHPVHCVFIWDAKGKGFRHELFPDYKANRSIPPEDLGIQIDNSKKFLSALALPQLEKSGYEADDIIATLVAKNPGSKFVIVTGDKDLLQLVNDNVWCLDTMKQKWMGHHEAVEKFGVEPAKIAEVQALSGDSVDNIPGAPGVGPKTATDLIKYFGSLDKVYEVAVARRNDESLVKKITKDDPLKGKKIESIADHLEKIKLSLKLVTLDRSAPVNSDFEAFHQGEVNKADVKTLCEALGFEKLQERIFAQHETGHRKAASDLAAEGVSEAIAPVTEAPNVPPAQSEIKPFHFKTVILSDESEVREYFQRHSEATHFCLDTETRSLESRSTQNLVGLSLCFSQDEGAYIPLAHVHGKNVDVAVALSELGRFLKHNKHLKRVIFQNAKFDLHVLKAGGLELPQSLIVDDTMLESFVLDPTEKHGMDTLAVKYLQGYSPMSFEDVTKGVENFSEVPIEEAAFYSVEDAVVTYKLDEVLQRNLHKQSSLLVNVYEGIDRPLLPILFSMEELGVYLDQERLAHLSTEWSRELVDLEAKAIGLLTETGIEVPTDFNLASPKQIGMILFEKLQLPVIKKTKTGASTDVSVLEELARVHPFPQALLEIRELQKLISTYVDSLSGLVDSRTQRLHTEFSQTIAATGRLASSRPNLQNIPIRSERGKLIREAFSVPAGRVLLGVDYSQIELRLLAHYSRDRNLLVAFKEGADIHRRTASLILGKEEARLTSDERRMAKTINFGIIYGQTAFGLSKQLGISRTEAQQFINAYFATYPGIGAFTEEAVSRARKTGFSETLSGRRRPIPDILSKNVPMRLFAERVAVNTPLQGTAADLIKVAMIRVYEKVLPKYPSSKMILQVHDELLFESNADEVEGLKKEVVAVMEDPHLLRDFGVENFEVLMKAEASIGKNWGALK